MIVETEETVFNTDAETIVNTINCDGFMGRGLALEFALRYPELEKKYIEECKMGIIKVGKVYFHKMDGINILNFSTKNHFQFSSEYKWIEEGLIDFCNKYKTFEIKSIAFPLLGCTNGELNKEKVVKIMKKYLEKLDITIYICNSKKVSGKEKEMVDHFKEISIDELKKKLRLNSKQAENLKNKQEQIKHFYDIGGIQSIGIKTYKKLFDFFYKESNINEYEQLRLFE